MTLNSKEPVHILLSGPPASDKTMFLQSMMIKLSTNSNFVDGMVVAMPLNQKWLIIYWKQAKVPAHRRNRQQDAY